MSERKVTIASRVGLHARPAAIFAEAAAEVPAEVSIELDGDDPADASSILSLMALGAAHGDVVVLRAEGPDAETSMDTLVRILETDLDAE